MNSRRIKDRACELAEGYEKARADEFRTQLTDEMEGMEVDEMDIDFFQGFLDSFNFQDENDWALDQAEDEYADAQEAKYEEYRDRKMGL